MCQYHVCYTWPGTSLCPQCQQPDKLAPPAFFWRGRPARWTLCALWLPPVFLELTIIPVCLLLFFLSYSSYNVVSILQLICMAKPFRHKILCAVIRTMQTRIYLSPRPQLINYLETVNNIH